MNRRGILIEREGLAKADHEVTAEGMLPTREAEPREAGGGLQAN